MTNHTCHAYRCGHRVPPEMFMCRRHWFSLPKHMQRAIWSSYRRGQCDDYQISRDYADAAQAAIRYIAKKENYNLTGDEPELMLYDELAPSGD